MKSRMRATWPMALIVGAVLVLMGCSSPAVYQMQSGERTAGADGEMIVTMDDNGNQIVEMTVAHLPQPSQLEEQMSTYVVWLQPEGVSQRYNMGRITLNDDRTGALTFTTPFRQFDLMVTAEAEASETSPSDQVVLRQGVGTN